MPPEDLELTLGIILYFDTIPHFYFDTQTALQVLKMPRYKANFYYDDQGVLVSRSYSTKNEIINDIIQLDLYYEILNTSKKGLCDVGVNYDGDIIYIRYGQLAKISDKQFVELMFNNIKKRCKKK